jgi:hypothetical protein
MHARAKRKSNSHPRPQGNHDGLVQLQQVVRLPASAPPRRAPAHASRRDKLELSDDEDTHPGAQFIEANTLRRIKRESHEVKEAERREKLAALAAEQEKEDASFAALEAKIVALSASGDDAAAEQARKELWAVQKRMDEREAEVKRLEKERKFNAEEMCHVSKEKTLVGRCAAVCCLRLGNAFAQAAPATPSAPLLTPPSPAPASRSRWRSCRTKST